MSQQELFGDIGRVSRRKDKRRGDRHLTYRNYKPISELTDSELHERRAYANRYYSQNKAKIRAQARRSYCAKTKSQRVRAGRLRIKLEGIEAYGGKCSCPGCNESRIERLSIDHMAGWSDPGRRSGHAEWSRLKELGWPKDAYQLLCVSCNASKGTGARCMLPHSGDACR